MLISMTGFGQGVATAAGWRVQVALSSVNHKGQQIAVRGDLRDATLEDELRRLVRERVGRGALTVQVQIAGDAATGIDRERIAAAWRELAGLAQVLGAPPPTLDAAATLVQRSSAAAETAPPPEVAAAVRAALATALAAHAEARQAEGQRLTAWFQAEAGRLRQLVASMRQEADARLPRLTATLVERVRTVMAELGQQAAAITPEILAREIALVAERIDVSEELTRLASHLVALDQIIAAPPGDDQGRRLEFLLQELGREINTTGAKANDARLTTLVLEAKLAVERLREQTANVA